MLLVVRQVWGWPFCGPAVQATKVSLDVFWKSEERRNGEGVGGVNGSSVGGGWIDFLCDDSSSQAGTKRPPTPPFHHPSVRSLHPCASVALGKWPLVVSCSWRVRSTAPFHLSFPSNCREIVGADRFSDKSIIFGTKVTLRNLMTFFFFFFERCHFFPLQ